MKDNKLYMDASKLLEHDTYLYINEARLKRGITQKEIAYAEDRNLFDGGDLFGLDTLGCIYSRSDNSKYLAVYTKYGELLKAFDIRNGLSDEISQSLPCIDEQGNIYFIESWPTGHRVYRITRTW